MEGKVISVVHLNKLLKQIVDSEELLSGILVSGEVTNFKVSGSHAYFTLKDEEASIFCTLFGYTSGQEKIYPIKNNDRIIAKGKPDFYVKGGSLSFKVTRVTPEGLGALYQKFLELKEKLAKEGLFDEKSKKPIPSVVKRIGVVTSPTGAVIRDIINVTRRRNPYVDIVLFPVKVQGENAEIEIAKGLLEMDKREDIDVIIVGRGGGSQEDLQAFNTEIVARAVFNATTPIISAVGHETDFSLCDFASDLRAPTPSAAAELATTDIISESQTFLRLSKIMANKAVRKIDLSYQNTKSSIDKLRFLGVDKINQSYSHIREKGNEIASLIKNVYINKRNLIKENIAMLDGRSPMKILEKGYSRVLLEGKAINSVKNVKNDQIIESVFLDGTITSKVMNVSEKGEKA